MTKITLLSHSYRFQLGQISEGLNIKKLILTYQINKKQLIIYHLFKLDFRKTVWMLNTGGMTHSCYSYFLIFYLPFLFSALTVFRGVYLNTFSTDFRPNFFDNHTKKLNM